MFCHIMIHLESPKDSRLPLLSLPGSINICIKSGNSRIAISHILLYDNDLG